MISTNSNKKICAICGTELISLGIEKRINRNHQNYEIEDEFGLPEMGTEIYLNEFSQDTHLKCRITCARYFQAGLAPLWYPSIEFSVTSENIDAYKAIEQLKELSFQQLQSNGIYLYGTPGLGKTHLLAELFKVICNKVQNPTSVYWGNTTDILINLRASFGKKSDFGEDNLQEKYLNKLKSRYLFLDDLGTESATAWTQEFLYNAINYRYEQRLPLFITSNLSPKALAGKLNDKFVSRLLAMCKPVGLKGDDNRLKNAQLQDTSFIKAVPDFSYQMAQWDINGLKGGVL